MVYDELEIKNVELSFKNHAKYTPVNTENYLFFKNNVNGKIVCSL